MKAFRLVFAFSFTNCRNPNVSLQLGMSQYKCECSIVT